MEEMSYLWVSKLLNGEHSLLLQAASHMFLQCNPAPSSFNDSEIKKKIFPRVYY